MSFPSLFISHGSPDLPLYPQQPAPQFLRQLGDRIGQPQAILVISAHWMTKVPMVSAAAQPETIHDFWGFPPSLYELTYPAPGAPELAEQVAKLLLQAGLNAEVHPSRGLDHGAWEPLLLMYPQAQIPVTQLSIQPQQGTAYHLQLGRSLAALRQQGVLILASGAVTHNLRSFGAYAVDAEPVDWAVEFETWLTAAIQQGDVDALIDYRHRAPAAVQNHPTDEHLLPLYVALGAAGDAAKGEVLHRSFAYGTFSMAAYQFTEGVD